MSDLQNYTLSALQKMLNDGACTAEEIVRDVLAQAERTEPQVGAYLELNAEEALASAREADQERSRQGAAKRPLLGVPISVKDVLNVRGQSCRCASRILEGYRSPYDATAIARLKEQGAILLGRTNMDEFAMGSSTENSAFGLTRNPWNTDYVPGGSSGGAAASVAARSAIASLGSDTGGSVRQPAAFCGCVGLKPSYGRISRYGLAAYASSLDQIGPITRDVRDAAILLQAMAGEDERDSTSLPQPVPDYTQAFTERLDGLTFGLPREYFAEGIDAGLERLVRAAVNQCEALGGRVVEVSLPHTEYAVATYYIIANAEASANLARYDGVRYGARSLGAADPLELYGKTRAAFLGDEVKRRILLGTYVLSSGYYDAYYLRAQKVRTLIRRDFETAFQSCDALLTPVAPTAAFRIGEKIGDPIQMYLGDIFTATANLAGICGLSVPCGFLENGLPAGLQILGPAFGEERILRVAHAYEQSTAWHTKRPGLADGEGV